MENVENADAAGIHRGGVVQALAVLLTGHKRCAGGLLRGATPA